jgi:hypothetical protein
MLPKNGVTPSITRSTMQETAWTEPQRGSDQIPSEPSRSLLRAHVLSLDASDHNWLFHGVTPERLAELLVQQNFDEGGDAAFLSLARLSQCVRQLRHGLDLNTLQAAGLSHARVA